MTVGGVVYDVAPELAGETVVLWWGLFDQDLYVEHEERPFGPYGPSDGPIPLHRYRKAARSKADERAGRLAAALADRLGLLRANLTGAEGARAAAGSADGCQLHSRAFAGPDPFQELAYPSVLAAKHAIVDEIGQPLAALPTEDRRFIDDLARVTLNKPEVLARVRERFGKRGS